MYKRQNAYFVCVPFKIILNTTFPFSFSNVSIFPIVNSSLPYSKLTSWIFIAVTSFGNVSSNTGFLYISLISKPLFKDNSISISLFSTNVLKSFLLKTILGLVIVLNNSVYTDLVPISVTIPSINSAAAI